MKKLKYLYIIVAFLLVIVSCEMPDNVDPKRVSDAPAEMLFTNGMVAWVDQITSIDVNLNISRLLAQYSAQVIYVDEGNFNFVDRNIPDNYFQEFYRDALMDLNDAKTKLLAKAEEGVPVEHRVAFIEIIMVHTYQCLVDAFGNIPYSEALKGLEVPNPVYDDAQTIYVDLLSRLNAAMTALSLDPGSGDEYGSADVLFNGDIGSWIIFANSLKARIGMRLIDVPSLASQAQTAVEQAIAAGIINYDGASVQFTYTGVDPYYYSIYEEMDFGGRKDYIPSRAIVDYMNPLNDPRLDLYFGNPVPIGYEVNSSNTKIDTIVEEGSRPVYFLDVDGNDSVVFKTAPFTIYAVDSLKVPRCLRGGVPGDQGNSYSSMSHFSDWMFDAQFPATLFSRAEGEFILAEAAERGFAGATDAEDHYINGITASVEDWGGNAADVAAYVALPEVAYNASDWKRSIGVQKWLALYEQGIEGWAEIRRLDVDDWTAGPLEEPAESLLDANPKRMPYPYVENDVNKDNKDAAASAIGGDSPLTNIFWDVD